MIYRKRGISVRWENGMRIRVSESGWARESGELFECAPMECGGDSHRFSEPKAVAAVTALQNVNIERCIVTRGVAEHEYGDAHWSEETHRFHASLTRGPLRVLVDREDDLHPIADALAHAELNEVAPPSRLRLAPNVTAALLPSLIDIAPPNVRLIQTAGRIDGYGQHVEETTINFYRPSYRVRPVRMSFDLRIECDVTEIERDRPIAIALLGPVESLVLPVLIRDKTRVYPSRVRVTRIDAVSTERVWYPYGAGSFGAELML
ncbi:MAG: hypothetical protein ACTHQM_11865 [Thermoanaerobaculia bacterium]